MPPSIVPKRPRLDVRERAAHLQVSATMNVVDLAVELQKVYDSEINVRISWLWDGGIEELLGDEINGFLAEESVGSVSEIVPWLQEAVADFFPNSSYAASLSPELKESAKKRLFQPQEAAHQ
jgi:hypothetical protein